MVRLERVVDQVRPLHVAGRVEALDAGHLLGLADALVGQVAGVLLLLDLEVLARLASSAGRSAARRSRRPRRSGARRRTPGRR